MFGAVGGGGGVLPGPPVLEGDPRQALMMRRDAPRDDFLRSAADDGNETADSEFLELPVDSALDMNRLSPSGNASPLTSASATPSPPPRHGHGHGQGQGLKAMAKITFVDEGFVL